MEHFFEIIKQTRSNFLKLAASLNAEELNRIPAGFNNNVIWNLGHIVVTQQALCYKLSGIEPDIGAIMLPKYGRGTKPDYVVSEEEIVDIKLLAVSKIEEFADDYQSGIFKTFTEYTTSYGIKLTSINDAIRFVGVHEGLHYGYAMAIRKALSAGTK